MSEQVRIGFSFESNRLRWWFFGPITQLGKAKPPESWIILDTRLESALANLTNSPRRRMSELMSQVVRTA